MKRSVPHGRHCREKHLAQRSSIPPSSSWEVYTHGGRKTVWQEVPESDRLMLLQRLTIAGTRPINRQLGIYFEESSKQKLANF